MQNVKLLPKICIWNVYVQGLAVKFLIRSNEGQYVLYTI